MPVDKAAVMETGAVLALGIGPVSGGAVTDRLSRRNPRDRTWFPAALAAVSGIALAAAFALPPVPMALGLIFAGALFAAAPCGPAVAMPLEVTPGIRATVTAAVSLVGNGLGNAATPNSSASGRAPFTLSWPSARPGAPARRNRASSSPLEPTRRTRPGRGSRTGTEIPQPAPARPDASAIPP